MKLIWVLALFALAAATTAFPENDDTHIHGENGWWVPQKDGSYVWMGEDEAEDMLTRMEAEEEFKERLSISTSPVTFYLYTAKNPKKGTKITTTTKSVNKSNFNAANPTRFVIHGWTQSYLSSINSDIRQAWLSRGDYNVIFVDWARARSVDYASSVSAVSGVGKKVAAMVDFLVQNYGMSLETLDVIGHSLGAHVAGFTGKNVKSGQVHTIVGLDPALPLFSYKKPNKRLNSEDGFYVESIQTNGGQLGFLKPIGKGAFYPNGGETQPGCILDVTGACSHGRSVTYYAEAIQIDDFVTMKCYDYEDAVAKNCGSSYSSVRMGAMTNAYMVEGDFYVPVNSKSPYGYGN
ncbi:phospholipase A1 VesT1.02-like [Teleopsis dalmanni]|uniref:phospholipase A1 VesT1.02-like n=1 Tax=Teleopsis dalmanni TaxID=139649 RepID=UPI0018CE9275|nr:phospholipase A1 VesT1.02-like [Teleopsis dalmanni]